MPPRSPYFSCACCAGSSARARAQTSLYFHRDRLTCTHQLPVCQRATSRACVCSWCSRVVRSKEKGAGTKCDYCISLVGRRVLGKLRATRRRASSLSKSKDWKWHPAGHAASVCSRLQLARRARVLGAASCSFAHGQAAKLETGHEGERAIHLVDGSHGRPSRVPLHAT